MSFHIPPLTDEQRRQLEHELENEIKTPKYLKAGKRKRVKQPRLPKYMMRERTDAQIEYINDLFIRKSF